MYDITKVSSFQAKIQNSSAMLCNRGYYRDINKNDPCAVIVQI